MKILLPKTLLEPVGILWWDIFSYEDRKSAPIQQALSEHMKWRMRNSHILSDDGTLNIESTLECLRIIVKRGGGRFPLATHEVTGNGNGNLYMVHYQIKRKCYRYSILLPAKTGSDLKARYAR
jgi:hypothetical protein